MKTRGLNSNSKSIGPHETCLSGKGGFTLLEVMISLAIIGGLLVTLIYTLNYQLGIADRHGVVTIATTLAKEKMYEMEKSPVDSSGYFREPYSGFQYETKVLESSFPGMIEIGVVVRSGKDEVELSELIIENGE